MDNAHSGTQVGSHVGAQLEAEDSPPGVNLARLSTWLDAERPGLRQGLLRATVIAGGRSNLTYRLTDGHSEWALRRPPLGHVLPTAHDMAREFTVISALYRSPVPVPEPIALCTDRNVLGAPFYLMGFVPGVVLERPELVPSAAVAQRATETLVDTLVALHSVDPATVGLSGFGRPEGFLQRQVKRWHQQFESSTQPDPGTAEVSTAEVSTAEVGTAEVGTAEVEALELSVVRRLREQLPESIRSGIVHGDYRLTNVLFEPDFAGGRASIGAVVDWEMATLGDPLTDVGLLYVYHECARISDTVMPDFPSELGFLSPQAMVTRYAEATGLEIAHLDWYIAFGYYKLSVIAAGIHARFQQGKTIGEGFGVFGGLRDATMDAASARLGGN